MPLRQARAAMRWGIRLDPTTGLIFLVAWAALNGITYFGPGETFETSHVYDVLIAWHVDETWLGAAQLADAVLLAISLRVAWEPLRVTVALLSALLWLGFGAGMLLGGAQLGFLSTVGAFSVLCGLGAGLSMSQWATQGVP